MTLINQTAAVRRVVTDTPPDAALTLTATWPGHPSPIVLAALS